MIKVFPGGKGDTPLPTFRGSKKLHGTQFKNQFYIIYIISELFTVKIGHEIYPPDYTTLDILNKTLNRNSCHFYSVSIIWKFFR